MMDAIAYADRTSIVRTMRVPIPETILRQLRWEPGYKFVGIFTENGLELTRAAYDEGKFRLSRTGLVGPAETKFRMAPGEVAAFEVAGNKLLIAGVDGREHESYRHPQKDGSGLPIPPSWLAQAFTLKPDAHGYLNGGASAAKMVAGLAANAGVALTAQSRVLDFGCGAGRVSRALHQNTKAEIVGYDLYTPAIDWCRDHMPFGRWEYGVEKPPIKEENGSFDLIFAISVLTHLDEAHQDLWLAEWKRLLKPNGVLIATFRSGSFVERFIKPRSEDYADKILAALKADGITHVTDEGWAGVFPDYYNDTYHTPEYVTRRWGSELEIVKVHPPSAYPGSRQDVAVLRKA